MCLQLAAAQNLVPDSSFERNRFVPMDFSALNASHTWRMPSRGTSDLFCKCDRKTKLLNDKIYSDVDVPQNPMGYQQPHSGTCYAGVFLFSHGDYREYLQTPLTQPLEKNKVYLLTMYISLADYSRTAIDQLGVCFPAKKSNYISTEVITDLNPVYINIENEIGNDVQDWHRVTVIYKAGGGESYLLLGSFEINKIKKTKLKVPKGIRSRINQSTERDAYYFIDDVSLVETYSDESPEIINNAEQSPVDRISTDTLFVLKNVLFRTNETELLPSSFAELDLIVANLKNNLQSRVEILGHTDNSGTEKINKALSTGRAKAVAGYISSHGIDKTRIKYSGYGSSKPVATNDTEEGRQQNRRVELLINNR